MADIISRLYEIERQMCAGKIADFPDCVKTIGDGAREIERLLAEIKTVRSFLGTIRSSANLALADYPGNAFEDIPGRDTVTIPIGDPTIKPLRALDVAPELDERLMDAVREPLRASAPDASEVQLASLAIDIIRSISSNGFEIT